MLKALIFDMDGTLADSDPVHLRAFAEILSPYGVVVDEEVYRRHISGRTNALIFSDLLPMASEAERDRLAVEKEMLFRRMATEMVPLDGLTELLAWADAEGLRLAIVTNAPRPNLDHTLQMLGLAGRFPVEVSGEELPRGKPDPLPYLTALDQLGIRASEAVAFEDSVSGVKAAKAAGIHTFGILTGQSSATLADAGADATLRDFADAGLREHLRARLKPAA